MEAGPVEGFYLVLSDSSIWAVKGCCHPAGSVVAIPRLVGGVKVKGYSRAMGVLRTAYPRYLARPFFATAEIPAIPLGDVSRILRPLRRSPCPGAGGILGASSELVDLLESFTGSSWMITGSLLYCSVDRGSDIDLVSYDADRSAVDGLAKLVEKGILRRLSWAEAAEEAEADHEGLDRLSRMLLIVRGMHSFLYRGWRVSIRLVSCSPERVSIVCSEKRGSSSFEALLRITDSREGHALPYIYRALVEEAASGPLSEGDIVILYSHRMRYSFLGEGVGIRCSGLVETGPGGLLLVNLDSCLCRIEGEPRDLSKG